MKVNLNCYAKYGTALWPGYSLQSPQGRKMWEADMAAKEAREAKRRAAAEQADSTSSRRPAPDRRRVNAR